MITAFRSQEQQLTQPNYRNARLEILTGSGNPVMALTDLERSTSWILFSRTVIEKFVLPIIDAALGPAGLSDGSVKSAPISRRANGP